SGVVVHDAKDSVPVPAVARERRVSVDTALARRAAVDELADLSVAAAIPRPLHARRVPVPLMYPLLAKPVAGSAGEGLAVRAAEAPAGARDGEPVRVDDPPEVVDRLSVARPQRVTVPVDAREPERI